MRVLSRFEADQLLFDHGLKVADWNELADITSGSMLHTTYRPSLNALELYVAAGHLVNWLSSTGWMLLQIDNSTSPTDDEIRVFERLLFTGEQQWNVGQQKSFLLDPAPMVGSGSDQAVLVLLVFFSLVFEWHVYLVSENSTRGQRLALQDGVIYFFGDTRTIESADMLVSSLAENPLGLSQKGPHLAA